MFGMSMIMMPIMTNGLNQLPTRLNPHGTAVNNTAQQIVGSIGTAVFVTLMNSLAVDKGTELAAGLNMANATEADFAQIKALALLEGIQYSFFIATIITLVALVLSLFLKRVNVSPEELAKLEKQ